jgi:hypothetical protein
MKELLAAEPNADRSEGTIEITVTCANIFMRKLT